MDEYGVTNNLGTEEMAVFAGAALIMGIIGLVIYLFIGFCLGKLFEKAGKPLWAGFVPIYNLVVILQLVGRPVWWLALFLVAIIPFIGTIAVVVLSAIIWIDFAKSYGKDLVWGLLITFFSIIMLPIMAFSQDIRYIGPAASGGANASGV
ncbi:MAG: hypothetical protein J5I53_08355 [Bradyrhizobiaceae bacterium]|nr:hypothetical protein [Bradyrhizobiaceae bacterium]